MGNIEDAVSDFEAGFSCSQSIVAAFGPELGLERTLALRVGAAMGGGLARSGETCGAVSGALMVIGLKYGRTEADDEEGKERAYRIGEEFLEKFRARAGSPVCRELLGYDVSDPEQRQLGKEKGISTSVCPRLVQDAAKILEEMLKEEESKPC
jgi:C_GCAxxG_C_C family probable redox protein